MFKKVYTERRVIVPELVVALPSGPSNGDQVILTDSLSAPTYSWLLQYVAAKASNKWVFIGGPPQSSEVATAEGTTATSYTALATAGPSVVLPVAGDYVIDLGCAVDVTVTANLLMSYDIGGTGAVDADALEALTSQTSQGEFPMSYAKKKSGLTAVTLTAKYKTSAGTGTFRDRWMRVLPIAVGG